MSDKRKREIRKLMDETGINYTRAAREVERRRLSTAPCAVDSTEGSLALAQAAEAARAADRMAEQMAKIGLPSPALA